MKTVELSNAVYQRLLGRVFSFEDTPEDVILRLLDETSNGEAGGDDPLRRRKKTKEATRRNRPRAAPGTILPEREYWRPTLEIIAARGGAASAGEVIEALGERLRDSFTPRDLERLETGAVRWRNRARFARLRMTQQGLLSDTSPYGVWEITDAGRSYLETD